MLISKLASPCYAAAAFAAVFAVVTAASEGVFRLLGDKPSADLKGLYAPFGTGSYRLAENVDTDATWAAGYWSVSTDALGLRCDKGRTLTTQPQTRLDVLLLGDSQGFGHGVSFEDSLAGSAALLGLESGRRIANASVGGHGSGNQVEIARWLQEERQIRADHLVYLCTPNAVQYPGSYVKSVVGRDGKLYSRELDGLQAWRAALESGAKQRTVVYGRLRDAVRNLNIGAQPVEDANPMLALYADGSVGENADAPTVGFANELKSLAERLGGRAHLVYVPLTVEFDFAGIAAEAAQSGQQVEPDAAAKKLERAAQEAGIGFFNLKPTLKQAVMDGLNLRLKGDFHYSREVSKRAGQALWTYLSAQL